MSKQTTKHPIGKALRDKLDELVVSEIRKRFGHVVAVEARIGVRYTESKHGAPYERFFLENGYTLFLTNWHHDAPKISISKKKADPNSYTIKAFVAAKKARAERKAERESREKEAVKKTAKR